MTLEEYVIELVTNPVFALIVGIIQFAALMWLKENFGERRIFIPLVVLFVIQNWIINLSFTVLFLDLPGKPFELVTGRMQRYKHAYSEVISRKNWLDHWRIGFAIRLCSILNRYDMGHC